MREIVEGLIGGYVLGTLIGGAIMLIVYAIIGAIWLGVKLFELIVLLISKAHTAYVKKHTEQAQIDAQAQVASKA
jgi:uncharacterized membrane protein